MTTADTAAVTNDREIPRRWVTDPDWPVRARTCIHAAVKMNVFVTLTSNKRLFGNYQPRFAAYHDYIRSVNERQRRHGHQCRLPVERASYVPCVMWNQHKISSCRKAAYV